MRAWHLITGAYPPQPGGVSDYTRQLCRGLARSGELAHVWAPALAQHETEAEEENGILVHRLQAGFSVTGLRELSRRLAAFPDPLRLFVQYVPHAFGYRAMNLPFCLWIATRRRERLWIMFHEAVFPFGERPLRTNLLAAATHAMAALLVNRADQVLVSTPDWERRLRRLKRGQLRARWLPIPSNLPAERDPDAVAALRQRLLGADGAALLGHFGTYGAQIGSLICAVVPELLLAHPERRMLLLGRGSEASVAQLVGRFPQLAPRILAPGSLPSRELALHVAACDLLVQVYPDGLSTRRTTLMAGLALGVPVVSNQGALTEPEWATWRAVAVARDASAPQLVAEVERLLGSVSERAELGERGRACYREHFSLERTLSELARLAQAESSAAPG
jgi:glycosyltransferase involved in cell wall biosynthesis